MNQQLERLGDNSVIQIASEKKYRAIFDQTFLFIGLMKPDGVLVEVNRSALKSAGIIESDVIEKPFWETPWWTHSKEIQEQIRNAIQTAAKGEYVRFETNHLDTDRKIHYIDFSLKPVKDDDGRVILLIAEGCDITERKQVEESLRESEEKFRTVIEQSYDGITVADRDGKLIIWNKAIENITGLKQKDVLGCYLWDVQYRLAPNEIKSEELARRLKQGITMLLDEKRFFQGQMDEQKIQLPDGTLKFVQYSSSIAKIGSSQIIITILRDDTECKKAEETLKANEQKYRLLIENLPQKIFVKDKNLMYVSCNENYAHDLKIKPDEIAGRTDYEFYPKELAEKYRADDKKIMESGKIEELEEKYIQNGEERFVHTIKMPLKDDEGGISGLIGIFYDITNHKRAEEALRESEIKHRVLFESSMDAIMILEPPTWKFTSANPATLDLFKAKTENEFIGLKPWNVSPERQPDGELSSVKAPKIIEKVMLEGSNHFEWLHKKITGEEFITTVLLTRVNIGEKTFLQATVRDITEQKKAETKIKESETYLSQIIEGIPLPVVAIDKQHKVTHWNTAMKNFTNISNDKIIGTKDQWKIAYTESRPILADFIVDNQPEDQIVSFYQNKFRKSSLVEGNYEGESFFPHLGSAGKWLMFSATPLKDNKGNTIGAIELLQDISGIKTAEKEILKSYDEIKKLAEQKNNFINQLGHDLQNPLGPILNLLPIVIEDTKDPKLLEVLDVVNRNAMYMKNLVMDILALARMEAKTIEFNFQNLDLRTMIEDAIKDNNYFFEKNNITTENRIHDESIVKADKLHLKEVFNNLLSNAIHYMYKQESEKTGGKIIINAEKNNDFITVIIQDTGIGLTSQQMDRVFEEFYKADNARHDIASSGLGLTICRRIIEKHGGKIWVKSEGLGKGSTFFFTLPLLKNIETTVGKNN